MTKRLLPILFLSIAMLASCGGNDDNGIADNGKKQEQQSNNANSNFEESNPVTHRLEFPRLKGGRSLVVTHYDGSEVNYSVEWDQDIRSCRWSAYEIYFSNRATNTSRYYVSRQDGAYSRQYPTDPDMQSSSAWTAGQGDPFWGSGYDHGHMCPSADRLNSERANYQTFYLTNMMPQVNDFNAGIWAKMEAFARNQIAPPNEMHSNVTFDTLYVVKGGTIDNADQVLQRKVNGMTIPRYYYMALLKKNSQGYKAMGFWIEHKANRSSKLAPYVVNIDRLETLTGLDFFCNLPDDVESRVESLNAERVKRAWGIQ